MGGSGSGKLTKAIYKLDGTEVDHDGKITKSNFFDFLKIPLGDYSSLEKEMTAEAALKFKNQVVRMKIGTSAAIPMLCPGPQKCPSGKRCPFNDMQKWPLFPKGIQAFAQCPRGTTATSPAVPVLLLAPRPAGSFQRPSCLHF